MEKIRRIKISKITLLLFLIIIIGVSFRAYRFHDFLRFNADQSRDAGIITEMNEKGNLLILGPQAGGTDFKLGPAFYYFQFVSSKIFGNYPDKLAYPDLFFSILGIIITFFFLKIYFDKKTSLALTLLFSISAYAIKYSRFAWNPNSMVFFVPLFLYAMWALGKRNGKNKIGWSMAAGVAAGICVQLHTFLLLLVPALTGLFFLYLYWRKNFQLKIIPIFLAFFILVNIPQIAYEIKSGGKNTSSFINSIKNNSGKKKTFAQNALADLSCNFQANTNIISALGTNDQCGMDQWQKGWNLPDKSRKNLNNLLALAGPVASIIFSIGGYILLGYFWKKEQDEEKKNFFFLISAYIALSFLVFFTVATEVSLRYYLMLAFVPFLLLGLWIKFLWGRNKKVGGVFLTVCIIIFGIFNLLSVKTLWAEIHTNFNNVTLSEVEFLADFIKTNSGGAKDIYVGGNKSYLFKSFKSAKFLLRDTKAKIVEDSPKNICLGHYPFFYVGSYDPKGALPKSLRETVTVENYSSFGHFTIYRLKCRT